MTLSCAVDAVGHFAHGDVPAGQYDLLVQGPSRQELDVQRVAIAPGEVTRVLRAVAAGGLRGRVLTADGTPPETLRGYVWVLPGASEPPADLHE